MTPSLIDVAVVQGNTGGFTGTATMPVAKAVALGKTLVVIVGNRWGDPWPPTLGDSQGNTYTRDASGDNGAGDQIAVFHSILATALSTSDTLDITAPAHVGGTYAVYAASFGGVSGFDVSGSVVSGSGVTLDASVTPADGDLLLGAHVCRGGSTNDTSAPWTDVVSGFNSGSTEISASYAVAAGTSTVHYQPAASTNEVAVALTFTATAGISREFDLTQGQAVSRGASTVARKQTLTQGQVGMRPTFTSNEFDLTQGQAVSLVGPTVTIHVLTMIPAVEMVGRPLLELVGQLIRPVAIASAEATGSATVEIVAPQEISLLGRSWIDAEGVGRPSLALTGASEILPSAVPLLSDVGVPVLMGGAGNPSPVGPRSVPRNVLIDRKTREVYPWPLNHSTEDALRALGRRITRSGITASGKLLATRKVFLIKHLSPVGPSRMMLQGTFMDRTPPTQYQTFVRFFQESDDRTFDFVDASGDAYHVAITQFDARRKPSAAHTDGSYFQYSLECEILDVFSGALIGHTR